jgi:hypothetical protein
MGKEFRGSLLQMFWIILFIPIFSTLVATFIWLDSGRSQIRRVWASVENRTLDRAIFTLIAIATVLPAVGNIASEFTNRQLKASLHEARQQLAESNERESLRKWAMVTSRGEEAKDVMGVQSYGSRSVMAERHKRVFIPKDGTRGFTWPRCQDTAYIAEARSLIKAYPKSPFAYVALAWCLKQHNDKSWRNEAEQAKKVLERLMKIHPHVVEIDVFYAVLIQKVFEEDLESTGYFQGDKDGIYVPQELPN